MQSKTKPQITVSIKPIIHRTSFRTLRTLFHHNLDENDKHNDFLGGINLFFQVKKTPHFPSSMAIKRK